MARIATAARCGCLHRQRPEMCVTCWCRRLTALTRRTGPCWRCARPSASVGILVSITECCRNGMKWKNIDKIHQYWFCPQRGVWKTTRWCWRFKQPGPSKATPGLFSAKTTPSTSSSGNQWYVSRNTLQMGVSREQLAGVGRLGCIKYYFDH